VKNANTPIDRIGKCFEHARTCVIAKSLGYRGVAPTIDAEASQISFMFGTYLSHIEIIPEAMLIACCASIVRLNEFDKFHPHASEVMSSAWELVGKRADESEALAEAAIALQRAQQLVALYRFHIDKIARQMIAFDGVLTSLPRNLQMLESIDDWPEPNTNGRPTTVSDVWSGRLNDHVPIAVHESSHVVAHAFFGDTISATSIDGNADSLGVVISPVRSFTEVTECRERMVSLAAGAIASSLACPLAHPGGNDDDRKSRRAASSMYGTLGSPEEIHGELKLAKQRATKIVHKLWQNVIRVAEALLEFQWTAMQIPRFTDPLESLDEQAITPTLFTGEMNDAEFITSLQKEA